MDIGPGPLNGVRYEGPQPLSDCGNDGRNEIYCVNINRKYLNILK